MKPQDLSNMLEDTAGTRVYQDHKEKAICTLLKKDAKVGEISEVMASIVYI